jgi:hypothetical protein
VEIFKLLPKVEIIDGERRGGKKQGRFQDFKNWSLESQDYL